MKTPPRAALLAAAGCIACLASQACSSSSGSGGGSDAGAHTDGGASSSSSGGASSSGGTGACTAPDDSPAAVTATCDPNAPQSPAGGSIVDGTYVTTADVYLGPSPCTSAWAPGVTLQVANGVLSFAFAPVPGPGSEYQQLSYSTSGTQITETVLCDTDPNGATGTQTVGYTAAGNQLTFFFPACCGDSYLGENVTFTKH
ncbi:MAG TPA: hypothetical protein VIF09_00015 [Polyangiaceae bacterium]|jgi:hypothetical protein